MARRGSARDGANKKWPPTTTQWPLGNQILNRAAARREAEANAAAAARTTAPNPKALLLQQGDKASSPQEHSCLCDWGEKLQSTPLQLQGRRVTGCRRLNASDL